MKYSYIILILCLITSSMLKGQSYCPPNGITTNPDAPINTTSPTNNFTNSSFKNTFFDWRVDVPDFTDYFDPDYVISPPYFPHHYSPYWGNFDYLSFMTGYYDGAAVVDFSPIEGWELITRGFGRYKNDDKNTGFYCPYFLMYNKYQGKFRIFFAVPSVDVNGANTIEVSLMFNNKINSDDDKAPVTGLFGHNGKTSQPLDTETQATAVKGIAKYNPSGWNFTDIVAAYDPCTCNGATSIQVNFSQVTNGTITLTGGFLGTMEPFDSGSDLLEDNMLLNIINKGTTEAVGVQTYEDIAASVADYNLGDGGISTAVEILSTFNSAFAYLYPMLDAFYPIVNQSPTQAQAAKTKYKKDLGFISRTVKYGTSLLKGAAEKKTLPTIIQGEIALTGDYTGTLLNTTASFVFDNPGTSSKYNNNESGISSNPSYPFYNEVLGRFAVLKTPKIKGSGVEYENGTKTSVYKKLQFDENSLEYVYNPAINVNENKTVILAALIIESSTNTYVNDEGYVPVIPNDADLYEDGLFLNQKIEHGIATNIDKEIYRTPYMPLECLGNYTPTFMTDTSGLNSEYTPFKYNRSLTPYLQLMIFYEFDELDRNGKPNKDIQILTYPLDIVGTPFAEYSNALPFERTITATNFTQNEVIESLGSITITGNLSASAGVQIDIIASEIIVADNVQIGEGINLLSGTPNGCGNKVLKSTMDIVQYCGGNDYNGDVRKNLPKIEPIEEPLPSNDFSMLAYPNPFQNIVTIAFTLTQEEQVTMKVHNALGQEIATLYNNETLQEGQYKKQLRQGLTKGIYMITLQTKTTQQTIRVVKQ